MKPDLYRVCRYSKMFGCCCANKKALKHKEQQKNVDSRKVDENDSKKSPLESPKMISASVADAAISSPKSELSESVTTKNDKSNSSEEGNNKLSGLIMSDGLVGN